MSQDDQDAGGKPAAGPVRLKARMNDEVADGTYSNLASIAFSPAEFFLDFGRVVPGRQDFKVLSRVIMTPAHAKRLAAALGEHVRRYEAAHGEIRGLPDDPAGKLAVH